MNKYSISPKWEENEIKVPQPDDIETIDKYVRDTLLDFKLYKINGYIKEIEEQVFKTQGEEQLEWLKTLQRSINIRNDIAKQLGRVMIP